MKYLLGIDLGATKILGGILDEELGIIHQETLPSRDSLMGLADLGLVQTKRVISKLLVTAAKFNLKISAAGIGFPEYVSVEGQLMSKDGVGWQIQPKIELPKLTGFSWVIESDVRCAALGEATLGDGKAQSDFLYVLVSSGISHTLVVNGRTWPGASGRAIGFGVTEIEHDGKFKTLESVASGLGIAREYQHKSGVMVSGAIEVFEKFGTDPIATAVIEQAAECLYRGLKNLVEVLDPEKIIIGGGLWLGSPKYRELVANRLPKPVSALLNLASLPNAGLIGAAAVARNSLINP
ncbi:MAG: ROK family protein [Actinomycetota bacterium]|nr:ROK family protein [Actinomycetota bacterium]